MMMMMMCIVCLPVEAVRKNPLTSKASNLEVESFVKKWLRNAADRMRSRSARMKKMLRRKAEASKSRSTTASHDSDSDKDISCSGHSVASRSSVDDEDDGQQAL